MIDHDDLFSFLQMTYFAFFCIAVDLKNKQIRSGGGVAYVANNLFAQEYLNS